MAAWGSTFFSLGKGVEIRNIDIGGSEGGGGFSFLGLVCDVLTQALGVPPFFPLTVGALIAVMKASRMITSSLRCELLWQV